MEDERRNNGKFSKRSPKRTHVSGALYSVCGPAPHNDQGETSHPPRGAEQKTSPALDTQYENAKTYSSSTKPQSDSSYVIRNRTPPRPPNLNRTNGRKKVLRCLLGVGEPVVVGRGSFPLRRPRGDDGNDTWCLVRARARRRRIIVPARQQYAQYEKQQQKYNQQQQDCRSTTFFFFLRCLRYLETDLPRSSQKCAQNCVDKNSARSSHKHRRGLLLRRGPRQLLQ